MKLFLTIILFTALLSSEYGKGKDLYFQNGCSGCHGIDAEGSGNNPKLANKSQKYIIKKLMGFQNGNANTQEGEVMFEFARRLKSEDLKNIGYFLSNYKKEADFKYEIDDDYLGGLD